DSAFYMSFRCPEGCETGLLLRAEKTAQGFKGIFVSLNAHETASYRITLDPDGRELSREKLRTGGGMTRIAPPLDPNARVGGRGAAAPGRGRGATGPVLPVTRPSTAYRPDDWNQTEILIDENMVYLSLNDSGVTSGVTEETDGDYGPLALYIGGSAEARFKDIAYRDLAIRETPAEHISPNFRMQRLTPFYYAWGAAAADFNHDGSLDIAAGPYIYMGPDYTKRFEIYPAVTRNPGTQFSTDCWMTFAADFTGDGWPDVITAGHDADGGPGGEPGVWLYINPKGESRRWEKHLVVPNFQSEIAVLKDIDGDGKPELAYMAEGYVRYAKPDPSKPEGPWVVHNVSERGYSTGHGIGIGDINGDGRPDIINAYGWWEQPPAGNSQEPWTYHSQAFAGYRRAGPGGATMAVYDVNGDGLNDVVTVLSAHGYGIAWYEQKRDASGKISFVEHTVMDEPPAKNAGGVTFSEPHGATSADVDGDGIPDFIVGKRYWAHKDSYLDPDPNGPAVLYVYRTVRNPKAPGGAEFVPELIHNWSGAGSDILAVDLNKDGAIDIVTATKLGAYVFWGKPHAKAPAGAQRH
ncbi:MAG TPA: VCBS repeat-containing protein, partial [Bryobacteraceae bacterium]|nr:VCBS repeat-containing protein [Bryobacteraceae bacterium]